MYNQCFLRHCYCILLLPTPGSRLSVMPVYVLVALFSCPLYLPSFCVCILSVTYLMERLQTGCNRKQKEMSQKFLGKSARNWGLLLTILAPKTVFNTCEKNKKLSNAGALVNVDKRNLYQEVSQGLRQPLDFKTCAQLHVQIASLLWEKVTAG